MTNFHVITPESAELVMQVIDGQLVIVPPPISTPSKVVPQTPELEFPS